MLIYPFRPVSIHLPLVRGGLQRYLVVFRLTFGHMVFAALVRAEPHDGPCQEASARGVGAWEGRPMEWAQVLEGDFLSVTPLSAELLDDSFQELMEEKLAWAERSFR